MHVISTYHFTKPTANLSSLNSTNFSLNTENTISAQVLNAIYTGLVSGAATLYEQGSEIMDTAEFGEFVFNIFTQDDKANISTEYGNLTITEKGENAFMRIDIARVMYKNFSIKTLQKKFIEDIITNQQYFSFETIHSAFGYIIQHQSDFTKKEIKIAAQYIIQNKKYFSEEAVKPAVRCVAINSANFLSDTVNIALLHVLNNPEHCSSKLFNYVVSLIMLNSERFSKELLLKSSQHIINHAKEFTPGYTQKAAAFISRNPNLFNQHYVQQAEDYLVRYYEKQKKVSIKDIAAQIIDHCISHSSTYPPEVIRAAANHIIKNPQKFSQTIITMTMRFIAQNLHLFPESIVVEAAQLFIENNYSFFATPLLDQKRFKTFFEKQGKFNTLQNYATNFNNILCSDPLKHNYGEEKNFRKKTSNYCAWLEGKFGAVLQKNAAIAKFILINMDSEAILLWKSANNT